MSRSKYLATGLLLAASPAVFAAVHQYEFHAVDPQIELASGAAVLVDLLRGSAAAANLHGFFDYDNEASPVSPILNFSGSAWGVSFDFAHSGLSFYPASRFGGAMDSIYVGPVPLDVPQPPVLGEYSLFLAGLQFRQAPPWIPADGGASLPADLSLLQGSAGLMEMCFSGPDNGYSCLFLHGVEIQEIPLPAGGGLLASALAGLMALRRRRRRA